MKHMQGAQHKCEPCSDAELIEALAHYAHEAWSGWMRYLFNKGDKINEPDGRIGHRMSADSCERWLRQMMTDYENLPEGEKESDRAEARKMLTIMRSFYDRERAAHHGAIDTLKRRAKKLMREERCNCCGAENVNICANCR